MENQTEDQSKNEMADTGKYAARARRWMAPVLVVALIAIVGMSGVLAYFTGTDTVENEFTISEGLANKIEVVEPHWDETDNDGNGVPDVAEDLVSLETVAKDPSVANRSDVVAWAFLQVIVPTAEVSLLSADGTPAPAAMTELFVYELNEGWVEHGEPTMADGYATHTYLYQQKVAPGETTSAAFDSVQLVNLVEAQGTSGADSIDVVGCAIQADGFANAEEAWSAYCGQLA